MPDNNSLDALFTKGLTQDQFITRYNELKAKEENNEDASSIFHSDLDASIGEIFKTLDTSGDGKLDEVEINALKNFDETDGKDVLSDSDIKVLYEKTLTNVTAQYKSTDAKEMYRDSVKEGGVKPTIIGESANSAYLSQLSNQMSILERLIATRQVARDSKIARYQSELDSLIIRESNLSQEEKVNYHENLTKINKKKKEIKQKSEELASKQKEIETAMNEVKYLQAMRNNNGNDNSSQIERWQNILKNLQSECNDLQGEISKLNSEISSISQKQQAYIRKAESSKQGFAQEKARLQQSITAEETACNNDLARYNQQMHTLESAQTYAVDQSAAGSVVSNYSDADTTHFTGDAKDLKAIWQKSHPNLSDGFYNKVCEISKRVGCDANALMAVMNSESGIKTTAQNPHGGATGLIQFMPATAKTLGTTTSALKQMSPEQQLVYVEKFLVANKKMAGFKSGEKLQQGQLYALVFLPAYAKREVLTVRGEKYYKYNKGLDMDKDGRITLSDLNARVEKMKPKGSRRA